MSSKRHKFRLSLPTLNLGRASTTPIVQSKSNLVQSPTSLLPQEECQMVRVAESRIQLARHYALFAAAAYCITHKKIISKSCSRHFSMLPECTVLEVFEPFATAARGFIATESNKIIISFRGTLMLQNMLRDLQVYKSKYSHYPGAVHVGFYQTAESVYARYIVPRVSSLLQKHPEYKIVVTGHSLGGAIAVLVGFRLCSDLVRPVECWTFGQPRIGDAAFADQVSRQSNLVITRVMRGGDWAVSHPSAWLGYRHHGQNIWRVNSAGETFEFIGGEEAWSLDSGGKWLKNPGKHLKLWDVVFGPWCVP